MSKEYWCNCLFCQPILKNAHDIHILDIFLVVQQQKKENKTQISENNDTEKRERKKPTIVIYTELDCERHRKLIELLQPILSLYFTKQWIEKNCDKRKLVCFTLKESVLNSITFFPIVYMAKIIPFPWSLVSTIVDNKMCVRPLRHPKRRLLKKDYN